MRMSGEAGRREIPLVTLDLNLTFMKTPESGLVDIYKNRQINLISNTEGTRDC